MVNFCFLGISCLAFQRPLVTMTTSSTSSATTVAPAKKTLRSLSETLSQPASRIGTNADIVSRTNVMNERTKALAPLTDTELDDILFSIQNLNAAAEHEIDYDQLTLVLKETAHLSHKDWSVTEANGRRLQQVLLPRGINQDSQQLIERILSEGNWNGAVAHAQNERPADQKPWAVLVTGVNGIRKSTSLYQEWFPQLLEEALVAPLSDSASSSSTTMIPRDVLPSGQNSFFRQLDHMIATLCNEDFCILYKLTADLLNDGASTEEAIAKYADLKAAIFGRYRTLSELLGAALLEQAKERAANCLMETSGRDVAMFHYVNHFFNKDYHKLALHFTIKDLSHACDSVDRRMQGELQAGLQALEAQSARAVVYANAGGPYGSAVLPGVQEASDKVWQNDILPADSPVASDWYKATIQVNAHDSEPWTAQAVRPDGTLGTLFTFAPKPWETSHGKALFK